MKGYNISISDVIRRALEWEELVRRLEEMTRILSKIPEEEVVEVIRSSREER